MNTKMMKYLVIGIFMFGLIACGSTPEYEVKKNFSNLPPTISAFVLGDITSDISQSTKFTGYMDKQTFNAILKQQLMYDLNDAGLLYDEKVTPKNEVATLNIFVDYSRHFMGDATPFPINVITQPSIAQDISIFHEGKEVYFDARPTRTVKDLTPWIVGLVKLVVAEENTQKQKLEDINNLMSISPDIVKYLVELTPNLNNEKVKEITQEEKIKRLARLIVSEKLLSQKIVYFPEYIPTSVADTYIERLSKANDDDLEDIYKDIYKDRLMSSKLFDWLYDNKVAQLFSADENYDTSTLKWLMKTFSSTGDDKYLKLFNKVKAEAVLDDVKDYVEDAITILELRKYEAQFVHNSKESNQSLNWKEQQLVNMVNSQENILQVEALKIIYKTKNYNEELLKVISNRLTTDSVKNAYRTGRSIDAHAWMCRVLGSSEDVKFKAALLETSKKARFKKVRKYAEKFADELP